MNFQPQPKRVQWQAIVLQNSTAEPATKKQNAEVSHNSLVNFYALSPYGKPPDTTNVTSQNSRREPAHTSTVLTGTITGPSSHAVPMKRTETT